MEVHCLEPINVCHGRTDLPVLIEVVVLLRRFGDELFRWLPGNPLMALRGIALDHGQNV